MLLFYILLLQTALLVSSDDPRIPKIRKSYNLLDTQSNNFLITSRHTTDRRQTNKIIQESERKLPAIYQNTTHAGPIRKSAFLQQPSNGAPTDTTELQPTITLTTAPVPCKTVNFSTGPIRRYNHTFELVQNDTHNDSDTLEQPLNITHRKKEELFIDPTSSPLSMAAACSYAQRDLRPTGPVRKTSIIKRCIQHEKSMNPEKFLDPEKDPHFQKISSDQFKLAASPTAALPEINTPQDQHNASHMRKKLYGAIAEQKKHDEKTKQVTANLLLQRQPDQR